MGRFDRPDRLFKSIRESWLSASGHLTPDSSTHVSNLQDVKELIPEFYYLPGKNAIFSALVVVFV